MGVDIDDIDQIIHWGESTSLLALWQEIGRAGRRGQESQAVILHRGDSQRNADLSMKTFIHRMAKGEVNCVCEGILGCLTLEAMNCKDRKALTECKTICTDCKCALCMCCNKCRLRCQCRLNIPN